MNDDQLERFLRETFQESRARDFSKAPGFDRFRGALQRSVRQPAAPRRIVAAFAALTLMLLVAGLFIIRKQAPVPLTPVAASASPSISSWRAPTDVLLHTPGAEVLVTVPSLRSSILNATPDASIKRRSS